MNHVLKGEQKATGGWEDVSTKCIFFSNKEDVFIWKTLL